MAITIKDVAKETNLAMSTISKYINGGNVRKKNQVLIEDAIRKLGYQPNVAARALRGQKNYTIGLITDTLESQFYAKTFGLIEKCLRDKGYSVMLCCHHNNAKKACAAVEFLMQKQVDGIMLVAIQGAEDCIRIAKEAKVPIVLLNQDVRQEEADRVMSNAATGVYEVIEYLIQKGHKRIGIINGMNCKWGEMVAQERMTGYVRALEDYSLPFEKELVINGDFSFMSGYQCMMELWKRPAHPTAVFVCNYDMCMGAITAICTMRIRIPEDLSFATFDDLEFSMFTKPELTATGQQIDKIAEYAVEILIKRIKGDYTDFPQKIKVRTVFTERNSVKSI